VQGYHPYDKMAWPIYEVINEHKLPAIFHTGHSGIGSGMRCGGGLRLEYSNPMHLDDVAIISPTCRSSWRTRASRGRTRR
jgi:predicted TIM-barrel fold metal-dependent hydrolase